MRAIGWACCALAVTLLTAILLGPAWERQRTHLAQDALRHELTSLTADAVRKGGPPVARPVPTGHALADLRIPELGGDWSWVVVEGVGAGDLAKGPGHYPRTPLPGARGNVAIAGHRAGHGDPFLDFDRLEPGDDIIVTQGKTRWTYRITSDPRIVGADASWVLDPLPGRRLTLTTCWPRYGSSKRMFVRARLTAVSAP